MPPSRPRGSTDASFALLAPAVVPCGRDVFEGAAYRHLAAAFVALLGVVFMLVLLDAMAVAQLDRRAPALAKSNLPRTASGVALQRRMAALPDSLMVYGSSELSMSQPTRADLFFRANPAAGFRVLLIGQPGDRCLIILEELAALGESARGKKFVIFLSPTWFLRPAGTGPRQRPRRKFARNFSPLQTSLLCLDKRLNPSLKADIVARLLDNKDVIEKSSPLLAYEVSSSGHRSLLAWLLQPLFCVQTAVFVWQDHWQAAWPSLAQRGWSETPQARKNRSTRQVFAMQSHLEVKNSPGRAPDTAIPLLKLFPQSDREFLDRMETSQEWNDLELLLRTSRQLGAHVMLVSQPFNGDVMDLCHVDAPTRHLYYERVRALAETYQITLSDFSGAEGDKEFFSDFLHPSAKGWICYDHVLDQFYHHLKPSKLTNVP